MHNTPSDRRPNRLIHETSPYLLQHASNPVDWYPWGQEALALAKSSNRPILLSIGYSACHWCHVMERESFENEAIAKLMNEHFVCVKVDREERPDLDEIYMQATLALNQGHGGWPMTVFLTPDQEPIFAGTYFPPNDKWGRPGFASVLTKIAEVWKRDRDGLRSHAAELTRRLAKQLEAPGRAAVGERDLAAVTTAFGEDFDPRYGGFGTAPKFPPATGLSLLLRCHARTGDAHTLQMVRKTLDGMAAGGMYDHIGGGFARYSTDERWLVPHFEKMLYDNALLARTYVEAFQVTQVSDYRRVATEVLDYIQREMTSPEGGFYSATDADSEGVEGKFFVWTPAQIREAVGNEEDARRFCAYYDITEKGNWEHTSIPNTPRSLPSVARELGISGEGLLATIHRVRPLVYEARRARVPPGLDDKIITAWNGMMISAMANAAHVFGDDRYLSVARRAADFLLTSLVRDDGGLWRTYRAGKAHLPAYLEDYACLAEGLLDLYEAGAEERYLDEAVRLAERIVTEFVDEERGGFFTTAKNHEALILRSREGSDGATPSGNAVAASVLARLSAHYQREDFRRAATDAIRVYGKQIGRYPRAFAKSLAGVDFLTAEPLELAFVGRVSDRSYQALREAAARHYVPNKIVAHHDPTAGVTRHPLLNGKGLVNGTAALYVCRNFTCQRPVTDPAEVTPLLAKSSDSGALDSDPPTRLLTGARLSGHATAAATGAFAVRHVAKPSLTGDLSHGYTTLGSTGLTTSRLGFGTYRVDTQDAEHREALITAIQSGCNLIDTSTNYTDGESERLIGSVLTELIKTKVVLREEVIVISKIGYVQGHNLKQAQAREGAGKPYPELVKHSEGLWHCIHPEFLADQLLESLDRLGLETLDVCLLHNPEYFLSHAKQQGKPELDSLREIFYTRLQMAFRYLETQVAAGRVQYYGVSSNTVGASPHEVQAISLSRILEAAGDAAQSLGQAEHHFRVLQCPMNLYESAPFTTLNTGPNNQDTVLDVSRREGIAVLVNRPLNAMPASGGGIIRLADLPAEPSQADFEEQRKKVGQLEEEYRREIAPAVEYGGQGLVPGEFFNWAEELGRIRAQVQGAEHWEQIEHQMIAPHVHQVLQALAQVLKGSVAERWEVWRDRYIPELLGLLKELRREATERSRARIQSLTARINPLLPASRQKESFSRKALWVLLSTPGVTGVLNGMRSTGYVDDSLGVLQWPPLTDVRPIYEALR